MKEIDIIELLIRVKEGKAPKEIEIKGSVYEFGNEENTIYELYSNNLFLWFNKDITLDTKIKILDKPIIEELEIKDEGSKYISPDTFEITAKVNEIIKWINEKN